VRDDAVFGRGIDYGYEASFGNEERSGEMKNRITSFRDLEVFLNSYRACIEVMTKIIPAIPDIERNDLKNQLRRSVKAIPRLIAEGNAKRHQKHGFQKYLDDAMGECNETMVGLEQWKDLYGEFVERQLCDQLIDLYDKSGRQLYNLSIAWTRFKKNDERNLS
jgi:four helix bundle protein